MKKLIASVLILAALILPSDAALKLGPRRLLQGSLVVKPACAQAATFFARLSPKPSNAMLTKYNQAICPLVVAGTWAKLDAFYVLAAENSANSLLNLVSTSYSLVSNGGMTFGPNVGYFGDGTTGYLNSGFVPSTAGGHYTNNAASMAILIQNPRSSKLSQIDIGTQTSTSTLGSSIIPIYGDGFTYASTNGAALGLSAATTTSVKGSWILNRSGSAAETLYVNNVSYITRASADTAGGLSNQNMYICAATGPSPPAPVAPCQDTIGAAAWGGALTTGDVAALNTAMQIFATDVPAIAAAWGFTATKFNDQSFASIDSANTGASTFTWYPAGGSSSGWFFSCCSEILTAAGDISVTSNVLTLNGNTNNTNYRARIVSRGYDGTSGGRGAQAGIAPGGYLEVIMAQDGSLHNTSAGTPTAWYQAISTIYGQSANTATSGGMEIDFTEMTGGVYTGAILDWTTTVGGGIGTSNGYSATGAAVPQVYNAQHSYAVNWVLSTQNGGTGLIQFMIDGILFKTLSYSSGAGSSPASTPSNPNGVYFGAESKTYAFLLDGGYHWPMVVSRVRALCKPGLNC